MDGSQLGSLPVREPFRLPFGESLEQVDERGPRLQRDRRASATRAPRPGSASVTCTSGWTVCSGCSRATDVSCLRTLIARAEQTPGSAARAKSSYTSALNGLRRSQVTCTERAPATRACSAAPTNSASLNRYLRLRSLRHARPRQRAGPSTSREEVDSVRSWQTVSRRGLRAACGVPACCAPSTAGRCVGGSAADAATSRRDSPRNQRPGDFAVAVAGQPARDLGSGKGSRRQTIVGDKHGTLSSFTTCACCEVME